MPMSLVRYRGQCWRFSSRPATRRMSSPWSHHSMIRDWMRYRTPILPATQGTRVASHSSSGMRPARDRDASAPRPQSVRICRVGRSARTATAHSLNPFTQNSPSLASRNASNSMAGSPATTWAAAVSWAARGAMTSRLRQPAQTLSRSHASGGVYWTVRPRRSRSAWAMPNHSMQFRLPPRTPVVSVSKSSRRRGGLHPRPMRVLIAPDKFRGTLTAAQAAHAMASGWRRARPGDAVAEVPMADGGEGTLDAMVEALGGVRRRASVPGPLGDPVEAEYGIVTSGLDPAATRTRFLVACDVDNPLTGPRGASVVFGPQKGATADDVLLLDRALGHLAAVISRDLGLDVRDLAGGGAAGGLGAGMVAFLGAHLRPGVELVMDAVGLEGRLAAADLVVTGEGSFDQQSLHGKVADGVLGAAHASGVRGIVLCGRVEVRPPDVPVFDLIGRFGEGRAMTDARRALEDLAEGVAAGLPGLSSGP